MLIEAAKLVLEKNPEAHFALVGEGTGRRKLGRRVREAIAARGLENRVHMLGYRWDVPDIMAAASVVAIASLHTEASPIVLREALASGRALVATRVGDVEEVVNDREHALLVSPGQPEELAGAILEFLNNRELATRCAANGFRLARTHFGFDQMMERKLKFDTELVRAQGRSTRPINRVNQLPKAPETASVRCKH